MLTAGILPFIYSLSTYLKLAYLLWNRYIYNKKQKHAYTYVTGNKHVLLNNVFFFLFVFFFFFFFFFYVIQAKQFVLVEVNFN